MLNQTQPKSSLESPPSSGNFRPRNVIFDQDATTPTQVFKKRKTMQTWNKQVQVFLGREIDEGHIDDGYNWRKYGQKYILGSNHPRGYYRCTHRNSQGCLATKQVQKSDQDSLLFEVTYRGRHTCSQPSQPSIASASLAKQCLSTEATPQQSQSSTLFNLQAGLEVKTESLDTMGSHIFSPFTFPSTLIEPEAGGFSPPFLSPEASETNYLSASPWHVSIFGQGNNSNVQGSESDHTETLSAPTSVNNSPIGDYLDFTIDKVDFERNFPFDSPEFFCG